MPAEFREPITKYRCRQCGRNYERMFELSDDVLAICPYCRSPNVERLIFQPIKKVETKAD
ncbi:MAG: zinc ribbon domain-containing protein [Dehalococcoidales bacterium]|nr:zinc ribbon domain-containing protein [Dehalococcoidales bacterium]